MLTGKTSGILSEKAAIDLQAVLREASEWIESVTGKRVEPSNFRAELENGIILCELIERIQPGSIKRINRMNISMAHLDNLKQFLTACDKFGLKDSQLFDVTDLQEPNTLRMKSGGIKHTTADRRLRNVCVSIYWLGRRLAQTPGYTGPRLNLEAFREILDIPVNPSNFYLDGYEGTAPPTSHYRKTTPTTNLPRSKQPVVTTTREIDLEPMSPPQRVEIKTPEENGMVPPPPPPPPREDDLTPDELLANIQNAVDELLLDYPLPSPSPPPPPPPSNKNGVKKVMEQVIEQSHSSPSPTNLSTPSPTSQPLPQFFTVTINCGVSGSLGLQVIGGADTAIPAQVEVVMPGKPADLGGLKAEDIIISVEQQDITRMAHYELIDFIRHYVGQGSLTLGVERSVEQQQQQQIHKSDSRTLWEEEQAERERQKKEVASIYNKTQTSTNGHAQPKMEETAQVTESEVEEGVVKEEGSDEEEWDIELGGGGGEGQREVPIQHVPLSTENSVSRLEEELKALNSYITKRRSVSPDVSGIGQILPNTVTGSGDIEQHAYHEERRRGRSESASKSESGENENEDENRNEDSNKQDDTLVAEEVERNLNRPEADGKEENVTMVTPNHSPVRTDSEEVDPFAPINLKPSNSTHLLSDVLSIHKTALVSTPPPPPPRPLTSTRNTTSHPPVSYHTSSSLPLTPYQTIPSTFSQTTPISRPDTSLPSRRPTQPEPIEPVPFEIQDEIQEMHGIKVRPVQRTRWTPETSKNRKISVEQKMLEKKSAIYERREVVMMEARGRAWSYASSQQHSNNSSFNKQGNTRPWSGQPKKNKNSKFCAHCRGPIFQGPLLAIPDKDLYFHSKCLVCVVCRSPMTMMYGRTTVFLRHSLPHCTSCYSNDNGIKVTTC